MLSEGEYGIVPNPIIDHPIKHNPKIRIFFLPLLVMRRPTIGDPMITATEYIQKMYPIVDTEIPLVSNSKGRKGTTKE